MSDGGNGCARAVLGRLRRLLVRGVAKGSGGPTAAGDNGGSIVIGAISGMIVPGRLGGGTALHGISRVVATGRRGGVLATFRHADDGNAGGQVDAQVAVPGVAFFLAAIGLGLLFLDFVAHAGVEQRAEFSEWSHVEQLT